jgi:putative addiction module killer protein
MWLVNQFDVVEYVDRAGRSPFREWLDGLDLPVRARVQARIFRIESGNLGKTKALAGGVHELKLDFGPGYRVYFAVEGRRLVVLLIGGDKKTQNHDIRQAKEYWADWQEEERSGKKKSRME